MRLTNNEVLTFCADDAHGAPIMMKADELGIEPTAFIDEINKSHQISLALSILIITQHTLMKMKPWFQKSILMQNHQDIFIKKK